MITFSNYLDQLRAQGHLSFTIKEAMDALHLSYNAVLVRIHRLKKKGALVSPARGFYVIVPPEERPAGCIPAEDLIPLLMNHKKLDYYVCLLTAAHYHGASHQKPQVFQVMVPRVLKPLHMGEVHINFIYKKDLSKLPVIKRVVKTGYLVVSAPALTAIDLLLYPTQAGGLNSIATVLAELIEAIDPGRMKSLFQEIPQVACFQRLGYLLEHIETVDSQKAQVILKVIHRFLQSVKPTYIPLSPELPTKGSEHTLKWRIIENTTIESDWP